MLNGTDGLIATFVFNTFLGAALSSIDGRIQLRASYVNRGIKMTGDSYSRYDIAPIP